MEEKIKQMVVLLDMNSNFWIDEKGKNGLEMLKGILVFLNSYLASDYNSKLSVYLFDSHSK